MAVSSCTFYDEYIEHAIEDMVIFGQIVAKSHFVTEFFPPPRVPHLDKSM